MIEFSRKTRLLTGVALGAGLLVSAQSASAQCSTVGSATTCNTTATTNTTGNGPTDRNQLYDTSAGGASLTVPTGSSVTGVGLASSPIASGANTLTVTNNGLVQVNAGNTAIAGGTAAFNVNATGATNVIYTGNGTVANLGTAGSGLDFQMSGTGNLTANVGGNVTSAVGGTGVNAVGSGTAGNLSLTTATGTTVRGDVFGVYGLVNNATSAGTVTVVNNAAVGSLTAAPNTLDFGVAGETIGTGAVSVTNNGAVGATGDRTTNTGVLGSILNATSGASLTVAGTGAVFNSGPFGVRANNLGTGPTTVNYTGAVNNTGATGVSSTGTTGAQTVTTGAVTAATDGVVVTSTGVAPALQTINANGVTTGTAGSGIVSSSLGNRIINVGTGGNVTGGTQAILLSNTGAATINNSGIIGGLPTAVAITGTAAGANTVNNLSGGVLNGRLVLGTGADSLVNGATFNTQGTSDFGAGADVLNNQAAGTINILGATTFANLETFTQNGRINLNNNTLTLSGTPFTNGGFIDTSGNAGIAGITSFNNTGSLDLAAGTFTVPAVPFTNSGTIFADEGASTITGQTSFANSGTIDLQDGATGDVLTINSSFVGSGGSNLLVDFDDNQSDRLIVGAASGSTTVNANNLSAGLFDIDGVVVVDTTSTTANAFILGSVGGNTSPLVDYNLIQVGQDFFLTSTPNPEAFDPIAIANMAGTLWYQSADEVIAQTDLPSGLEGFGAWGQVYYSQDKYGDDDEVAVIDGVAFAVDNELKTDRYGIQAGVEYGFGGARLGLTGGYGVAKADNDLGNDLKAKGWNIGVYGAFGGLTGFHGSALLKHDRYDLEFDGGAFDGFDADLKATGVDGSLGYRFGIGGEATLDAKVGLAHVRTKIDDITAFGFNYDLGTVTSTRGRAGLRAAFGGSLGFYAEGSVLREFDGDGNVELFDGATFYDIDSDGKATWFRLEAGLAPQLGSGPILAAWADLGDKKGFGLRAGFRFGGRAEEAAPPPPPPPVVEAPPPPPPPATQTCPDGSVILATDACPPPPPPPPPAPEPERG